MTAKTYNTSLRKLYYGGMLSVILDAHRQFDEIEEEHREQRQHLRDLFPPVESCPCGCGAGDACEEHLESVRIANEAIPF